MTDRRHDHGPAPWPASPLSTSRPSSSSAQKSSLGWCSTRRRTIRASSAAWRPRRGPRTRRSGAGGRPAAPLPRHPRHGLRSRRRFLGPRGRHLCAGHRGAGTAGGAAGRGGLGPARAGDGGAWRECLRLSDPGRAGNHPHLPPAVLAAWDADLADRSAALGAPGRDRWFRSAAAEWTDIRQQSRSRPHDGQQQHLRKPPPSCWKHASGVTRAQA